MYPTNQKRLFRSSLYPDWGQLRTKRSCYNGLMPAAAHTLRLTGVPSNAISDDDVLYIDNLEGEESSEDLDIACPVCVKSDQHDQFIDISDFSLEDLPELIMDPAFVAWVWNCIPLVVRLRTSNREYIEGTGRVIPFSSDLKKTCTNISCPHRGQMGSRHEVYEGPAIITSRHVVPTSDDVEKTFVDFFYHENSRHDVVVEMGLELKFLKSTVHHTVFTCTAHSIDLIEMISMLSKIVDFSWRQIPRPIRQTSKKFALVISHPHGKAKRISIGRKVKTEICDDPEVQKNFMLQCSTHNLCKNNNGFSGFEKHFTTTEISPPCLVTYYTAATCKGSSGAPVYMGYVVNDENGVEISLPHTHAGTELVEGCYLNYCKT